MCSARNIDLVGIQTEFGKITVKENWLISQILYKWLKNKGHEFHVSREDLAQHALCDVDYVTQILHKYSPLFTRRYVYTGRGENRRTYLHINVNIVEVFKAFGERIYDAVARSLVKLLREKLQAVSSFLGQRFSLPKKLQEKEESKIPIHKFRSAHLFIEDCSAPSNISIQNDKLNLFSEKEEDPAPDPTPEQHDSKVYQEGKYPLSDKYRNIAGQTGLSSDYHDSLYIIYDANQHGKVVKNGVIAWRIYCENKFHGFYGARNTLPEAARERIKAYCMFTHATTDEQALALYQAHKQSSLLDMSQKERVPREIPVQREVRINLEPGIVDNFTVIGHESKYVRFKEFYLPGGKGEEVQDTHEGWQVRWNTWLRGKDAPIQDPHQNKPIAVDTSHVPNDMKDIYMRIKDEIGEPLYISYIQKSVITKMEDHHTIQFPNFGIKLCATRNPSVNWSLKGLDIRVL